MEHRLQMVWRGLKTTIQQVYRGMRTLIIQSLDLLLMISFRKASSILRVQHGDHERVEAMSNSPQWTMELKPYEYSGKDQQNKGKQYEKD